MASIVACASVIALAAAAVGLSGAEAAGQGVIRSVPAETVVCVRHDGSTYGPHCVDRPNRAKTCDCGADFHVTEPNCHANERPAPSTPEANRVRFSAAAEGSLKYAKYQGRRFCVAVPSTDRNEPSNYVDSGPPKPCCGGS
jgi:hypothetical protein